MDNSLKQLLKIYTHIVKYCRNKMVIDVKTFVISFEYFSFRSYIINTLFLNS